VTRKHLHDRIQTEAGSQYATPKTWRRGVSIARRHKFAAVNGKVMLELWSIISVLNPHHHVYVIIRLRDHKIVR
jgi:hypothetical protein